MTVIKETSVHPSNGMVIRYNGEFNFDSLYKSVKSWFGSYRYDYYEKEMTEKNKPQGNSVLIKISAEREVDDYAKFVIEIDFNEVLRIKKTEKGNLGELRAIIRAKFILDYKNNWKNFPFLLYLYNNVILKKKVNKFYFPKLYDEMMDLNSMVKRNLGLIK